MSLNQTALTSRLRVELLQRGIATMPELSAACKVSRHTVSRVFCEMNGEVVSFGRRRGTRYALAKNITGLGGNWSLYRINSSGKVAELGKLHALANGNFLLQHQLLDSALTLGDFRDGWFPALPWFLADVRPQGFLGRAIARRHARELGAADDPRLWTDEQTLAFLLRHGGDLPGDLVLGDHALTLALDGSQSAALSDGGDYGLLAEAAMRGEAPASSAGGEQPKFVCRERAADGAVRHLLVKFSPPLVTPAGRRWADLLLAEQLAARILREQKIPAADADWLADGQRAYLRVTRFDRAEQHGRRGMVSLHALDAAHFGELDTPWTAAAARLEQHGWLSAADARALRFLWWFGNAIGNTDRHYGNISLCLADNLPLSLTPAYDMLPMLFAPSVSGELVEREFAPTLPPPSELPVCRKASQAALLFWQRLSADINLSADFAAIARNCGQRLQAYCQRLDLMAN